MADLNRFQWEFTELVGRLILHAYSLGYTLSFGYTRRSQRENQQVGGHPRSTHLVALAVDLNLFKDGEFLTSSDDHHRLGEWWEQQHPLARWGGRWNDGNHYSFEYDGVK